MAGYEILFGMLMILMAVMEIQGDTTTTASTAAITGNSSESNSADMINDFVNNHERNNDSWKSATIQNVLIALLAVLVIFITVLGFRYMRSKKKRESRRQPAYNKLNTNIPVESDEYEMSIYEKK